MGNDTIYVLITSQAKFNNMTVVNCHGVAIHVIDSSFTLNSMQIMHCRFCVFNNLSSGGAVSAYNSNLVIGGNTIFPNNSANSGGAISLLRGSINISGNTVF